MGNKPGNGRIFGHQSATKQLLTLLPIGGDAGIRTLDTGFGPYAPLAGECLRPLGHISGSIAIVRATQATRQMETIRFI